MAQSKTTTLNIRALDTPIRLRAMASNIEAAIPELTASSRLLLHAFVDTATQVVAEYRDINPRAITLNKLWNGKVRRNRTGKKHLGMARVMDRKTVDAGLKGIAQKKIEAAAAEKAKLGRKEEAAAKKIIKEQVIQQKKATREAQAVLEAQWNAEYAAAEASWRLERDQARAEHRKPPTKPVKPPRPRTVGIGSADSAERGAEDLEQAGNAIIEVAQDMEAIDNHDAEELADMVRELEISEFSNMVN
ncbi:hypothetical protein EV426DRAFT_642354 [Tirmania nivea]|nr:hypothetical protein EV426DRAFT_642354 [Tirmania nivea]